MNHTLKSLFISSAVMLPAVFASELTKPNISKHQVHKTPVPLTEELRKSFEGVGLAFNTSKKDGSTVTLTREGFQPLIVKGYLDLKENREILTMWVNGLDLSKKDMQELQKSATVLKLLSAEISKMKAVEYMDKKPISAPTGEVFPDRKPDIEEQLSAPQAIGRKLIWMEKGRMTHQRINFINGTYLLVFIHKDETFEQLTFNKDDKLKGRTFLDIDYKPLREIGYSTKDFSELYIKEFDKETMKKSKLRQKSKDGTYSDTLYDKLGRVMSHVQWYASGNKKSELILDPEHNLDWVSETTYFDESGDKPSKIRRFTNARLSTEERFYPSGNIEERIKFYENGSIERLQTFADAEGSPLTSDTIELAPSADETVARFQAIKDCFEAFGLDNTHRDERAWADAKLFTDKELQESFLGGGDDVKRDTDDEGQVVGAKTSSGLNLDTDKELQESFRRSGDDVKRDTCDEVQVVAAKTSSDLNLGKEELEDDLKEELDYDRRELCEHLKVAEAKVSEFKQENDLFVLPDEKQPKAVVNNFNPQLLECKGDLNEKVYNDILKEVHRIGGVVIAGKGKCKIYLVNKHGVKLPIINMHKFHNNSGRASINMLRRILEEHDLLDIRG